jgi:hypothetical protein
MQRYNLPVGVVPAPSLLLFGICGPSVRRRPRLWGVFQQRTISPAVPCSFTLVTVDVRARPICVGLPILTRLTGTVLHLMFALMTFGA